MNEVWQKLLHFFDGQNLLGNTLAEWTTAAALFAGSFLSLVLARALLKKIFSRLSRARPLDTYEFFLNLAQKTYPWIILIVALHIGAINLELHPPIRKLLRITLALSVLVQLLIWGNQLIELLTMRLVKVRERKLGASDPTVQTIAPILRFIGRLLLFAVLLLLALDNLGVNISALLTGLGIGGVAVALAVQNILGDLFASLSIALDRPFEVGDAITVNNQSGTVERIGLRTTRLRSVSGEELVFPNNMLLNSQLQNMRRMSERRASFTLGVTYETRSELLDRIPQIIAKVVSSHSGVRFERADFRSFGDSALVFEVIYWTESRDLDTHRGLQHQINLDIFKAFGREGIAFAYPTQTLYVRKE